MFTQQTNQIKRIKRKFHTKKNVYEEIWNENDRIHQNHHKFTIKNHWRHLCVKISDTLWIVWIRLRYSKKRSNRRVNVWFSFCLCLDYCEPIGLNKKYKNKKNENWRQPKEYEAFNKGKIVYVSLRSCIMCIILWTMENWFVC